MAESFIQLPADSTGKKARTILDGDVHSTVIATRDQPTFWAVYDRIVPAANKYMATLFNTSSTRKIVVQRIWVLNWQITAVTGVLLNLELWRITARTAGTSVTPVALDTGDTLSSGMAADHNSSSVTDSMLFMRVITASEETKIGALTLENYLSIASAGLLYEKKQGVKGITLRQNQGISLKNITSSTVGSVSTIIEFTDEEL